MKYHLHPNLDFHKLVSKKNFWLDPGWLKVKFERIRCLSPSCRAPSPGPFSRLGDTQVPGAAVQAASAADGRAVHPREDPWLGGYTSFSPQEERAVVRRAGV